MFLTRHTCVLPTAVAIGKGLYHTVQISYIFWSKGLATFRATESGFGPRLKKKSPPPAPARAERLKIFTPKSERLTLRCRVI